MVSNTGSSRKYATPYLPPPLLPVQSVMMIKGEYLNVVRLPSSPNPPPFLGEGEPDSKTLFWERDLG
ncbi:MAG: hypothetical protein LVT47_09195 [Cyanobacteria bacterium LVE1205-1]